MADGAPPAPAALLGPAEIRQRAEQLSVRPTKSLGQNFLHDANTIRRIVRTAQLRPGQQVLEIGPGLGSLTFGLLDAGASVVAVEIDPVLAQALPGAAADRPWTDPSTAGRLAVVQADALQIDAAAIQTASDGIRAASDGIRAASDGIRAASDGIRAASGGVAAGTDPGIGPTALVANLPYNIAVPVVLRLWSMLPALSEGLVLVQAEVAHRLAAGPGSRVYGVPSAKAAWSAAVSLAGSVSRSVFWPVPNVDSALVRLIRRPPPDAAATREQVFAVIDAAFAQRRKMLRAALGGWAGSTERAARLLDAAGIDPTLRGEALDVEQFARIAAAAAEEG
jgi:16S rRNA (adenine1518-N6/adenine1519-N6)-dimethyltransferase